MKYPLLALLIFRSHSQAVTFEVIGAKGETLFFEEKMISFPQNVGDLSVAVFDRAKIPYDGGAYGFSKIFDLKQEIEFISDKEMKAYGWCFSLDEVIPDSMPDQTLILDQDSHIQWFYSYAHYKEGHWVSQCQK